jgi:Icc-related predicted phosphoesterase
MKCFFVTDLHGDNLKYSKLFRQIDKEGPKAVFLGGDLLAGGFLKKAMHNKDFINNVLAAGFLKLQQEMGRQYPHVFLIMGNDDPRCEESLLLKYDKQKLWHYINQKHISLDGIDVYGYCRVPPSPFLNKDWERYDVSRYVDIGCVAPEEGYHTTAVPRAITENRTIWEDLQELGTGKDLAKSILLFHAPPYQTGLDRAALDGKTIDFAPLDVHVGSIAIRRFIEEKQPLVSLHGHVHESYSITRVWKENIGSTVCLSAAGTGKALSLVRFSTEQPYEAERQEI